MHAAKRRRLDQSGAFFNKPFRSPLRRSSQPHSQNVQLPTRDADLPEKADELHHADEKPVAVPSAASADHEVHNLQHKPLQKQRAELSLQHKQLCQSLDMVEQALQFEESGQEAQLQDLIGKWRAVAREAADELFVDAKDRIDQMGGAAAWRRRTQEDISHWNRDKESYEDAPHQRAMATRTEEHDPDKNDEEDESSFTMATMLRQMNVDLRIMGYDEQSERWVD